MQNIIGHNFQKKLLINCLNSKHIPHAWLLCGPKGIGKSTTIREFIKLLLKLHYEDRRYHIVHPDFLLIDGENTNNKISNVISIEEIRNINIFLRLTPIASKYKIALIDNAEKMNINASNALLKILEDPPIDSIIFLLSHNHNLLSDTIKSRCITLRFHSLTKDEFINASKNLSSNLNAKDIQYLYNVTRGSLSLLQEIVSNNLLDIIHQMDSLINTKRMLYNTELINIINKNTILWEIFSQILLQKMHKDLKELAYNNDVKVNQKLDIMQKIQKLLKNFEDLHLDKVAVLQYILNFL